MKKYIDLFIWILVIQQTLTLKNENWKKAVVMKDRITKDNPVILDPFVDNIALSNQLSTIKVLIQYVFYFSKGKTLFFLFLVD